VGRAGATQTGKTPMMLERSLSLVQATLDATADGILVVDHQGTVVAFNRRFVQLWRIPEELVAKKSDDALLEFVHEQLEDPDDFMRGVETLYRHPDRESFDALRFKDGRVFERYSRPQRVGDEVVGRVWSFRDVSERERLLGRASFLSEATRLLVSLDVETALDAVARLSIPVLGDRCAVDLFEPAGPRRLLTISRDPNDKRSPELPATVYSGHTTTFAAADASYLAVPLRAQSTALGAMIFASPLRRRYTGSDMELGEMLGERVALCIVNARLFRDAQDALRTRADFISIVAHEIRSPLTSLHLSVQRLRRRALSPDEVAKALDMVERDDRRLGRFVDELLDVGRIQAGRFSFDVQDVDFAEVVREAAAQLGGELARSHSSLSVTAEPSLRGHWDPFRLEQVVTNLLSNAIKFGLGRPIEISLSSTPHEATLRVTDQGNGIPPEMHEKVFLPFERAVSVKHYGGLGLGLYIVRTIVVGLGGSVRVESAQAEGTSFIVTLPRQTSLG
jgi:PAS domain S-box-containing protein